ncbi:DNA-directed RNA polymerase subunit H [archaeon]|nr:DNA-directed RNA polymerase subunit H [archaeon]
MILEHILVPKHEILSKTQVEKFLKENKLEESQFPGISEEDPVIKAIKAKKGDLIKITRDSITAGESVYYRIVY